MHIKYYCFWKNVLKTLWVWMLLQKLYISHLVKIQMTVLKRGKEFAGFFFLFFSGQQRENNPKNIFKLYFSKDFPATWRKLLLTQFMFWGFFVCICITTSVSSCILTWLWYLLGCSRSQLISLTWEEMKLCCPLASFKRGIGDLSCFLLDLCVDLACARIRWVQMEEEMGCICVLWRKNPVCLNGSELSGQLGWHLWILCELAFVRCCKCTVHQRPVQMLTAHVFSKTVCIRMLLIFSNFILNFFQINNTLQK